MARIEDAKEPFRLVELRGGVKPFRLHFFSRLRSTNDHAAALRARASFMRRRLC
jgi:hypothetical protein